MDFANYIEAGMQRAGSRPALAEALAVSASQITNAKDRGLPVSACYALAELIEKDVGEITAASELVTEKKPERRAVLMRYLAKIGSTAAGVALIVGTTLPDQARAVTPENYQNLDTVIFRTWLKLVKQLRNINFKHLSQLHRRRGRHFAPVMHVTV